MSLSQQQKEYAAALAVAEIVREQIPFSDEHVAAEKLLAQKFDALRAWAKPIVRAADPERYQQVKSVFDGHVPVKARAAAGDILMRMDADAMLIAAVRRSGGKHATL